VPGVSRSGALMESFFHTLKMELVYFEKYRTRQDTRGSIFEYIEVFYNCVGKHSALNYCSPTEFEGKMCNSGDVHFIG